MILKDIKFRFIGHCFFIILFCGCSSQSEKSIEQLVTEVRYEEALIEISKSIIIEPDNVSNYKLRATIYDYLGKFEEGIEDLSTIIQITEKNSRENLLAYQNRAVTKLQLGLYSEALEDINYFIENRDTIGNLLEIYMNKASILYKLGDVKNSRIHYQLVLEENNIKDSNIESQALVGLANLEEAPQKALELLNEAISIDNENATAYGARSALYIDLGKFEEAYNDSSKALYLNPNDVKVNFNMGQIFAIHLNNIDSAIIYFEKAIQLSPQALDNDDIYLNLGVLKQQKGNPKEALILFEKAEQVNPENDLLLYNFASLLSDLERDNEALMKISRAISNNSKVPDYFNLKGSILLDLFRYDEAKVEFEKAIKLNPNYGTAYYNLGYMSDQQNEYKQAIRYYDKAVRLNFDLEATLVNRAILKIQLKRLQSACKDLNRAFDLGRKDIQPLIARYCIE